MYMKNTTKKYGSYNLVEAKTTINPSLLSEYIAQVIPGMAESKLDSSSATPDNLDSDKSLDNHSDEVLPHLFEFVDVNGDIRTTERVSMFNQMTKILMDTGTQIIFHHFTIELFLLFLVQMRMRKRLCMHDWIAKASKNESLRCTVLFCVSNM